MVEIKEILDEIANESSTKKKMEILNNNKDNKLLVKVLYKACSRRIKFYIKQIPEYSTIPCEIPLSLEDALNSTQLFSNREITGHSAIGYLKNILQHLNPNDAYVLERIIEKDLKIGMGTRNINKVIPNLIEKTPYMGAKPYSEKLVKHLFKDGKKVYSQIKMDGRYANIIVDNGEVEMVSRQGETTHVGNGYLIKELSTLPNGVYNGELTIDGYDRYTANGMVSSIVDIEEKRESRGLEATNKKIEGFNKKHGSYDEAVNKIRFTAWDVIELEEYFNKKSERPYHERLKILINSVSDKFSNLSWIELKLVTSIEEAIEHFKEVLERGLEGTVLKLEDGGWKDGKGSHQIKMKIDIDLDLKIVGFKYGTKGTKNEDVISTLITESSCGKLATNPAGMKEDMMKYVTDNQDKLLGTIVEIRCCGLSQNKEGNWSTLHPSVVKLRDDKEDGDTLESALAIENMNKKLN